MLQDACQDILGPAALLGCGGSRPGIQLLRSGDVEVETLLNLPTGASVYALDIDAKTGVIGVGTRDGQVSLISRCEQGTPQRAWQQQTLPQGAPVLAVCLTQSARLVSSDVAGRCLLWPHQLSPGAQPKSLVVHEGVICSLLDLGDGRVLGLSSHGRIHVWELPSGRLQQTGEGPRPAPKYGLVNLTLWSCAQAIAYPSEHGELALIGVDATTTTRHAGHEGGFHALAVRDRELFTVGSDDGRMTVWTPLSSRKNGVVLPDRHLEAPKGVLSCAAVNEGGTCRLLLVHRDGRASINALDSNQLQHEFFLTGDNHRVAVTVHPGRHASDSIEQHEDQRALHGCIAQKISVRQFDGLEELYSRLDQDRYPLVSLALRAQEASARGDSLTELHLRRTLVGSLSRDHARSATSLRRYVDVLERLWLFAEAHEALSALCCSAERFRDDARRDRLAEVSSVLRGSDPWVIAGPSQEDLSLAVQAADAMGAPFCGRWLLERSSPVTFPHGHVDAEIIAAKYENTRAENGPTGLPHASAVSLWWISTERLARTETAVFGADPGGVTPRLQLALEVQHDGLQPVLVRSVYLDAGGPASAARAVERNQELLAFVRGEMRQVLEGSWLRGLKQAVHQVLKRLTSEALSSGKKRQEA